MIQAQLGLSREQLDAQRVKLLEAQENRSRQLLEPEIASRRAQAQAQIANARLHELQTQLAAASAPLERQRLEAQIKSEQAKIGDINASIALSRARTADVGLDRAQRNREYLETTYPVKIPTGKDADGNITYTEGRANVNDLVKIDAKPGDTLNTYQQRRLQDLEQQRERQGRGDEEKRIGASKELEGVIKGRDNKGNPNYKNPAVEVSIDEFNRTASDKYVYEYKKGAEPLKIPTIDPEGKGVEARHFYSAYQAYKQKYGEISLRDFAKKFREGK